MSRQQARINRALLLVPYIARHTHGVLLDELASTFGISRKDVERELDALMSVGRPGGAPDEYVTLFRQGKGATARVTSISPAGLRRPPRLTNDEAFALLLGLCALSDTGIESLDSTCKRLRQKLEAGLKPANGNAKSTTKIVHGSNGNKQALPVLAKARRDCRVVALDYASLSGQRRRTLVVEPHALLNHRGVWYLVGRSRTHGKPWMFLFRTERILGATALDETFTPDNNLNATSLFGDRAFYSPLSPSKVTLRLRGALAAQWISRWKASKRRPGGAVEVSFKDYPAAWLAAWIVRQGPDAEVVEPVSLRNQVAQMALAIAAAHR